MRMIKHLKICVCVCAIYLLLLSSGKPITFQQSPNILVIITGLACAGLYWRFEVFFLCVHFLCKCISLYVYVCRHVAKGGEGSTPPAQIKQIQFALNRKHAFFDAMP